MSSETHAPSARKGVHVEIASIVWTLVEAVAAISAGVLAHSVALTAFGADSVIELVAGGVLLWRLMLESSGAGFARVKRAETISSWVVGVALMLLAVYIVVASIVKLMTHQATETSYLGLGLAAASGVIMPYLARAKKRIGSEIGSNALRSDGSCSMVCAYMAWILLVDMAFTAILGWWWIDIIASLALVYYVVKEGWEAIEEARGKEDACNC